MKKSEAMFRAFGTAAALFVAEKASKGYARTLPHHPRAAFSYAGFDKHGNHLVSDGSIASPTAMFDKNNEGKVYFMHKRPHATTSSPFSKTLKLDLSGKFWVETAKVNDCTVTTNYDSQSIKSGLVPEGHTGRFLASWVNNPSSTPKYVAPFPNEEFLTCKTSEPVTLIWRGPLEKHKTTS